MLHLSSPCPPGGTANVPYNMGCFASIAEFGFSNSNNLCRFLKYSIKGGNIFSFLEFIFIICALLFCLHVCLCESVRSWELQTVVNCHVGAGIEPGSSTRVVCSWCLIHLSGPLTYIKGHKLLIVIRYSLLYGWDFYVLSEQSVHSTCSPRLHFLL